MYIDKKYILKSLSDINPNERLLIYGSGSLGQKFKQTIDKKRQDLKVIGFLDSFKEDLSQETPLIKFSDIDRYKQQYDLIVVASDFWLNIVDSLQLKGIDSYKIIDRCFFLSGVQKVSVFFKELFSYSGIILLLMPLNYILGICLKSLYIKKSVLHVGPMVHTIFDTVSLLNEKGWKAKYLSINLPNETWGQADYVLKKKTKPYLQALSDFIFFWKVMARYKVIHSHFFIMLSASGWELPILKKMERKIVFHGRGCHMRNKELNEQINTDPQYNICACCDYDMKSCTSNAVVSRRVLARMYGDEFLVTTPDLLDFIPEADVLPFFAPEVKVADKAYKQNDSSLKIAHITNHPGIEGTASIEKIIAELKDEGFDIDFINVSGAAHDAVLKVLSEADLTIGKMKMGYYANAQVESMNLGVPAVTYVRSEYMTETLKESGFIFSDLKHLKETIKYYFENPDKLKEKQLKAKSSIKQLNNNAEIIQQLERVYVA